MYTVQRMRWGIGGGGLTEAVKKLLIANGIIFVLQYLVGSQFVLAFGLIPRMVWSRFFIWQFITYMFLHGGIFHLLINMYVLWMFGTEVE
ncbi:rhomboid family intramembrane serine protease, partial [bacterium]|nr:rhomboid family intramembrane serine protease [bacterium]